MTPRYTVEELRALLVEHDGGVLKSGPHSHDEREFCAMEFVAKIAGEPWTDNPSCVHPALAAYCRALNDATWGSDEARTETMLPLLVKVFGTRDLKISVSNIALATIREVVPPAFEAAADAHPQEEHKTALRKHAAILRTITDVAARSADAAWSAWSAAWSAARSAARSADAAWSAADAAWSAARSAARSAADAARSAARSAAWSADADAAWSAADAADADAAWSAADAAADAARSAARSADADAAAYAAGAAAYKISIALVIREIDRATNA